MVLLDVVLHASAGASELLRRDAVVVNVEHREEGPVVVVKSDAEDSARHHFGAAGGTGRAKELM